MTTTYISQSGGLFSGGSACNGQTAVSVATFNASTPSAGNIYYLCGTITSPLTIGGSGSAGNVIQFLWDAGARISVAFGNSINVGSQGYLLFDGGIPCGPNTACYANESASPTGYPASITGIIEATANGSGLANQNVATQAFNGCSACHDIEIRNLIIRNLYQHTSTSDATANADGGNWVFQCGSGQSACTGTFLIHDNDIHDTGNALSMQHFSSATIKVYNNEFWRNNWAYENSGNGTRTTFFYNNHCHDATNWDTTGDTYHHNCIHSYMNTSSDSTDFYIYNNQSDGDWGTCCTTSNFLFIETAPPANLYVFNNLVIQKCSNSEYGVSTRTQSAGAGFSLFANNTLLGCASTASNVEAIDLYGTGLVYENNAIENYGQYVVTGSTASFTTLDYNSYGGIGLSGNSPWQFGATGDNTFAAWQTSSSGDTHGQKLTSLNVNSSSGVPNSGSGLIGAGTNLTSLCSGNLTPLCSDKNGIARPSSGAWTVGAVSAASSFVTTVSSIWP